MEATKRNSRLNSMIPRTIVNDEELVSGFFWPVLFLAIIIIVVLNSFFFVVENACL